MNVITISRKLAKKDDLVVISRKEYEALLQLKRVAEFAPTSTQKRALTEAKNNLRKGKTMSYNELTKELGVGN